MVHGCFILLFYMVYSNRCSKWNTTLCEVQLMLVLLIFIVQLFHDGGRYIETSPLICRANQWTGFYTITAFVMKELTG